MDIAIVSVIVQLIFLEGILSIDNAAVLGAIASTLPDDKPIPWPKPLQFLATWGQRTLGNQRTAALRVGIALGYVLRGIMLALASWLITVSWIRIVGAIYLGYLGIRHFGDKYDQSGEDGHAGADRQIPVRGFWVTVGILEFTDLVFSVDNVIAAVALSNILWVVMLGVAIGIILMRFAATLFSRLIAWEPMFEASAFLLLFAIGVELILHDVFHINMTEIQQFAISAGILLLTLIVARTSLKRPMLALLKPFRWLCYAISQFVDGFFALLLMPFKK